MLYAERRILFNDMPNGITLSVIMLSAVAPNLPVELHLQALPASIRPVQKR
jgi:hypothetical protein